MESKPAEQTCDRYSKPNATAPFSLLEQHVPRGELVQRAGAASKTRAPGLMRFGISVRMRGKDGQGSPARDIQSAGDTPGVELQRCWTPPLPRATYQKFTSCQNQTGPAWRHRASNQAGELNQTLGLIKSTEIELDYITCNREFCVLNVVACLKVTAGRLRPI